MDAFEGFVLEMVGDRKQKEIAKLLDLDGSTLSKYRHRRLGWHPCGIARALFLLGRPDLAIRYCNTICDVGKLRQMYGDRGKEAEAA